jgi:SAM-dependent methyltransferase
MTQHAHEYQALFYQYQQEGSRRSAKLVLPEIVSLLGVTSVLDIGCGVGAWLSVHRTLGVTETVGVDGDYVDRSLLQIANTDFLARDIAQPFDLGRRFDLVECLEVAEHVPHSASETLVDNITRHGDHILFSAAVPGQGGENHINEQPLGYWRDLFEKRNYQMYDFLRPRLRNQKAVEPWYRFNILFFSSRTAAVMLPQQLLASAVSPHAPIPDYSPLSFRCRRLALGMLPHSLVSRLATLKHRLFLRSVKPN